MSYCTVLSRCCQPSEKFYVVFIQHAKKLDAGDRFELPMHLAYETGVVATLPAIIFIYCKTHYLRHHSPGQLNVFYDSA